MNVILVPTDFSKTSYYAFEVARELVIAHGSKLVILYGSEVSDSREMDTGFVENEVSVHRQFENLTNDTAMANVDTHGVIVKHLNAIEIMGVTEARKVDLIVMGLYKGTGLKNSVAMWTSKVPILFVREPCIPFKIKNFVLASNLHSEQQDAIRQACELAQTLKAQLHIVFIITPDNSGLSKQEINSKFANLLQPLNMKSEAIIRHTHNARDIELGILNFADKINADLIGIPIHSKQGLSHLLVESISENIINRSQKPVVTFKIEGDGNILEK